MDTRTIFSFLKKTAVTVGVGSACGAIGFVEGAISGSTGAAILQNSIKEAAKMGAIGVGVLGFAEGIVLGFLATNGFFGTYEEMQKKGFSTVRDRLFAYLGYTANQVLGGLTATLFLKLVNSPALASEIIADVYFGASTTGIVITPLVTFLAALLLDAAYRASNEPEEPDYIPMQLKG